MKKRRKGFWVVAVIVIGVMMSATTKGYTKEISAKNTQQGASASTTQPTTSSTMSSATPSSAIPVSDAWDPTTDYRSREIAKLGIMSSGVMAFVKKYDTNKDGFLDVYERGEKGPHSFEKKYAISQGDVNILCEVFPGINRFRWNTGELLEITIPSKGWQSLEIISKAPSLVKVNADSSVSFISYIYEGTQKIALDLKNASGYKDVKRISVKGKNIIGLSMPENIESFEVDGASISQYVVSGYSKLSNFSFGNSKMLKKLTIKNCPKLTSLVCSKNQVSLLSISGCPNIKSLSCQNNKIKKLKLGAYKKLEALECTKNKISKIDVTKLGNLSSFDCSGNNISKLNVKHNPKLASLMCANNKIKKLSLASNKKLHSLVCFGNKFKHINISHNKNLHYFHIGSNYTLLQDTRPEVRTFMYMRRGQKLNLVSYAPFWKNARFKAYTEEEHYGVYGVSISKNKMVTMKKAKNKYHYYGDFSTSVGKKTYYICAQEGENRKCDYDNIFAYH